MQENELNVQAGSVLALRLFDISYEIDLQRAEELWTESARGPSARSRLLGTLPKAVSFGVPPLTLELGSVTLEIGGRREVCSAAVRLYDFGIAAVTLRFSVRDMGWSDFVQHVNSINQAVGPATVTDVWNSLLAEMRTLLRDALHRPTTAPLQEDYLIAVVNAFDSPITAEALQARVDLVPVLSGQDRPLSDGARRDLLSQRFSYYTDDLAVITWDRAFLYEPRAETDVTDVLEIANAQLLEMRTYDEMLDDELPRLRDLVEAARRRRNVLAARRYARLAQRLQSLVAEVTELAERVDNALQVTEDVYLARVYAATIALLRVPIVGAAVDRKLAIMRETYTALHQQAAGSRAELLEIAILALIAVEIVLSLVRH